MDSYSYSWGWLVLQLINMAILPIKLRYAYFYDDKGEYLGRTKFSKWNPTLRYKNKAYNVLEQDATKTLIKGWFWDKEIYQFNINNPNPFLLDKKHEPVMNSEVYNAQLETKVIKDLNDLSNDSFMKYLTPQNIILFIAVIVIAYYLLSGHKVA